METTSFSPVTNFTNDGECIFGRMKLDNRINKNIGPNQRTKVDRKTEN